MPDIPDLTAYIMTGTKYLLPILALWILLRCIRSMLREKYEPETWAWLLDEDGAALPVSHWESIIGRSPSSDIVIDMPSVSKLHASLQRDGDGDWTLSDLRSREGTYINGDEIDILEPVEDGDTVEFGDAVMTFREIDAAERAALERRRTAPGRFVGPGVTLLILSLFQAFLTLEFTITAAQEYLFPICLAFFALMVTEWFCYLVTRSVRRTGFEPETLAFFLTTLGTAVCATATPEDMFRQTIFIILGVALYFFLGAWLRSLERVKSSRFIAAAAALGLLAVNVVFSEAVFGAKNPHPQFLIPGGVTCYESLTPERIKEFRDLYLQARKFIEEVYIPDLLLVAGAYKDWAALGCGCRNFMAFGEFPEVGGERDITKRWLKPGVLLDGKLDTVHPFDAGKIAEHVRHSWYEGEEARAPYDGETKPAFTRMGDTDRYSWLKAPRYDGLAMETGPLAQMLVAYAQGHEAVKPAVDKVLSALGVGPEALFSTLGRTAARGVETLVIAQQVEKWLAEYEANIAGGDKKIAMECSVPREGRGVGFVNAPRGGLSHWLRIEDGKIGNFQLVVPTTWNLGPRDAKHVLSAAEQALVGTPVADPKRPVEILRTIHSFDPCIACAVHVIDGETNQVHEFKVL